jgi:hypothetical protein
MSEKEIKEKKEEKKPLGPPKSTAREYIGRTHYFTDNR